ncbi:MAG: hypothetical protein JO090_02185, partial [Rhizobacter sp.]|nr:hypothetical protein [Rhizobacter sp.]
NALPITAAHLFLVAGVAALVGVPMYSVLTATPFARTVVLGAATLVAFAGMGVFLSILQRVFAAKAPTLGQAMNFVYFIEFAASALSVPLVLGWAIGSRRVRGVAPFVFAGLLVFAIAPLLGVQLTQWLAGMRWSAGWVLGRIGIDTGCVVLALPVRLLAWWRLKALARGYEAKRFSDAQLLAHSWWLPYVAFDAVTLINAHPGPARLVEILVVAVVAYLLLPLLLGRGLAWAPRALKRPPRRTLLLLRVFGDTARTATLFERIASRWQRFGPVTMTAAPDVVAETVDPGDLLRLVSGRGEASFVASKAELVQRLATMDAEPDRDGRYRMTALCCRDDTWQATLVALIARADAIVMDLRGFTVQRHGCEFELGQLVARTSHDRIVLVVEATTDRALLARSVPAQAAPIHIIEVARGNARQADQAFAALLAAAA